MEKVRRPRGNWRDIVFGGIVLLVIVSDFFSKWWIRGNLQLGQTLFDAGFFRIIRIYNTGAAFGIFKGHALTFIIIAIIGIAVILSLVILLRGRWPFLDRRPVRVSVGLVLGGTAGNLIDRLLHGGRVTDFADFTIWPAFNIAD